jgi:hypothetical protein
MAEITKWRGAGGFIGAGPDKRAGAPTQSGFAAGALLQEEVRPPANCPYNALPTGSFAILWPLYQFSAGKCAPQGGCPQLWRFGIKLVSRTDPHSRAKARSEGPHFESLHRRQDVLDGDGRWR